MIIAHCSPEILGSSDPSTSASQVARTTGMHHHAQLIIYLFILETRSRYIGQADLEILAASHPPQEASQSTGIIAMNHCAQQVRVFWYPSPQGFIISMCREHFKSSCCFEIYIVVNCSHPTLLLNIRTYSFYLIVCFYPLTNLSSSAYPLP
uniref:Uncharacterized protein n=1 Tax=Macaca fascicularis TaxID=9541 RepID=A0A7N9D2Y9_MACFA